MWIHIFGFQLQPPHHPDTGEVINNMPDKPSSSSALAWWKFCSTIHTLSSNHQATTKYRNQSISWFIEEMIWGLSDGNGRILKLGLGVSKDAGGKKQGDSGALWGQRHLLSGRHIQAYPQGYPGISSRIIQTSGLQKLWLLKPLKEISTSLCIFFINLYFNCRIIALQNFVVFCQTSTWISYRYTHVPSLFNLPRHPTPLGWYRVPVEFPETYSNSHWLFYIYGNVSVHVTLFIHLTLSSPLSMTISLFFMSVSPLLPWK